MSPRATRLRRLWHRLRHPPIGYQHGRRARFARNFPLVCWSYYLLIAHTTPRFYLSGLIGAGPVLLFLLVGFENRLLPLAFTALALIVVCMVAGLFWRPALEIEIRMPPRVECGSHFETHYTIRNPGRRCELLPCDLLFAAAGLGWDQCFQRGKQAADIDHRG